MKYFSILIFFAITFSGCNNKSETANNVAENHRDQKFENKFFDYDEIDYYSNDLDEEKIGELYDNQLKSKIDSIKMGVILGNIPNNITDLSFIEKLDKLGYKKSNVDKSKFKDIDKIFVEKTEQENVARACINVYRDILIFKKNSNVVGTAKICFGCYANQINGTNSNTENFGQNGDYEKLATILRK